MFVGGKNLGFKTGQAAYGMDPHCDLKQLAHSSLLTLIASKMGLPLDGSRYGYSGPQALDPMSLGIV